MVKKIGVLILMIIALSLFVISETEPGHYPSEIDWSMPIIGSPNSVIKIDSPEYSAIDFYHNGINLWGIGKNLDGDFYIDEFGVDTRLFIEKSTGNVGIGIISPIVKLHVNGIIKGDSIDIISVDTKGVKIGKDQEPALVIGKNKTEEAFIFMVGGVGMQNYPIQLGRNDVSRLSNYVFVPNKVTIGNKDMPVEQLYVEGDVKASGEICDGDSCLNELKISLQCVKKRGDSFVNDQIIWCPEDYPIMFGCSAIDDDATDNLIDFGVVCPDDGECFTNPVLVESPYERQNLGADNLFRNSPKGSTPVIEGCLSYDNDHIHTSYRLDLMCCKSG